MTLKEKAEKIWQTLKPEQKKKMGFLAIGLVIVVLSLLFYKATRGSSPVTAKPNEGKREVSLDKGTLEKSLYSESTKQMADLQAELKAMKEQMALEKKPVNEQALYGMITGEIARFLSQRPDVRTTILASKWDKKVRYRKEDEQAQYMHRVLLDLVVV